MIVYFFENTGVKNVFFTLDVSYCDNLYTKINIPENPYR